MQVNRRSFGQILIKLLRCIPLIPVIAIVRLLSPFVLIRFRGHYSSRIGHWGNEPEVYLCQLEAGVHGPPGKIIDVFFYNEPVCNEQLAKMWNRVLRTVPFSLDPIERLLRITPGGRRHLIPWKHLTRDLHGLLERMPGHIDFTDEERAAGRDALVRLGVPADAPFVCFHARDSAFMSTVSPGVIDEQRYRDVDIQTYVPALASLTACGYYAIRLGAVVAEPLRTSNPRIIDYPLSGARSDFLDIYIPATAALFISSGSGPDAFVMTFRRPSVIVNAVPLEYSRFWDPQHVFIPRLYRLRREDRLMTFREIVTSGAGRYLVAREFEDAGIDLVANTAEEIHDVCVEAVKRLQGTWTSTPEDEELQRRFMTLFQPGDLNTYFKARIGAAFLRKYQHLLA